MKDLRCVAPKKVYRRKTIYTGPEPRGFHTCCKIEQCVAKDFMYTIEIDDLE